MIRLLGAEEFSSSALKNPNLSLYKVLRRGLEMSFKKSHAKFQSSLVGLVLLLPFLSACSLEASIRDISSSLLQTKSVNKELVPSSHQGIVTAQGYKVQSSVNFQAGEANVTTAQGFKVQTNVQATLFIEE